MSRSATVEPLPQLRFEILQAARILRMSRATLYERIRNGDLKAQKDGRRRYITAVELHRYVGAQSPTDRLRARYAPQTSRGVQVVAHRHESGRAARHYAPGALRACAVHGPRWWQLPRRRASPGCGHGVNRRANLTRSGAEPASKTDHPVPCAVAGLHRSYRGVLHGKHWQDTAPAPDRSRFHQPDRKGSGVVS